MQTKHLEYLLKVVECGSISKAAEELYISQPSLTKAVKKLEEEYGLQILRRRPRGVGLTIEGRDFVHYARGVLAAANALEKNFLETLGIQRSRLFLATQQLDFVYEVFHKTFLTYQNRRIHYNLVETDRHDVIRQVLGGEADLGLLVRNSGDAKTFLGPSELKRLDIQVLDRGGIYACVGAGSPYFGRSSITFSESEQCLQVVLDMGAQAKQDLCFDVSENHFNTNKIIFVNTVSACEHLLTRTDALLFVSPWTIGCFQNAELHSLRVLPDHEGTIVHDNELLCIKRAGEPLSATEHTFLTLLHRRFHLPAPEEIDSLDGGP